MLHRPKAAVVALAALAMLPQCGLLAASVSAATVSPAAATAPQHVCTSVANRSAPGQVMGMAAMEDAGGCEGYWTATNAGAVATFGAAPFHGDLRSVRLNAPVINIATTRDSGGYYLLGGDGGIFTFGDARFFGSTGGIRLNQPVVAMAVTPGGGGYWLVGRDGGVFTFGDAHYYGSTGGMRLNEPIVGMASTPDGGGYWLVASDGGIFTFGDAHYYGSTGGVALNRPIVTMTPSPGGGGYRLFASDGGVFSFGDAPFYGSLGSTALPRRIVAGVNTADGGGYWMVDDQGTVRLSAGDGSFLGDTVDSAPLPVLRVASLPENADQVILAMGAGWDSSDNTIEAFDYGPFGWQQSFSAMAGHNGFGTGQLRSNYGVGWEDGPTRTEGDGTSPTGIYPIQMSTLFGNQPDPGGLQTAYTRIGQGSYWDENPSSPEYNTYQVGPVYNGGANCGSGNNPYGGDTECLWQEGQTYPYFANILYNPPPTHDPIGAAIFLHADPLPSGSLGIITGGCISTSLPDLLALLRWLSPGAHPVMVMGPDWSSF